MPKLRQRTVWVTALVAAALLVATGLGLLLVALLPALLLLAAIHYSPNVVLQNFCQDAWLDDTRIHLQLKQERIDITFNQIEKITWHGSNNPPRAKTNPWAGS